jgi:hypothetical protein
MRTATAISTAIVYKSLVLAEPMHLESVCISTSSIFVQSILRYKTFAFAALIIWLIAGWSGAHGHLCFDGQEPPVTVHMHTLGEHTDHAAAEQHVDADVDLSQPLLAKLTKIDLPLVLAAALLLAVLLEKTAFIVSHYSHIYASRRAGLRPPLRAPPVFPA